MMDISSPKELIEHSNDPEVPRWLLLCNIDTEAREANAAVQDNQRPRVWKVSVLAHESPTYRIQLCASEA